MMHRFSAPRWTRCLRVSGMALLVSVILALFQHAFTISLCARRNYLHGTEFDACCKIA